MDKVKVNIKTEDIVESMSLEISRLSREKAYLVASNKALTEQLQNAKDTDESKPKKL